MRLLTRSWLSLGVLALGLVASSESRASEIRDTARMFEPDAVRQAKRELDRIEREYGVPVLIETIEDLPGHPADTRAKHQVIQKLAAERDRNEGNKGIYILMSKDDKVISTVLVPGWLARHFGESRREGVRDAFIAGFKKGDFNAGLLTGVNVIDQNLAAAKAEAGGPLKSAHNQGAPARQFPGARPVPGAAPRGGSSPWGAMLMIGAVILGVVLIIRLLGSLFGGRRPMYGPGGAPMQGPGGMMGPGGYGGGYGGGGGGFWSGMLGGLGGAMAGNWLYDRMSGRHMGGGQYYDPSSGGAAPYDAGGNPADNEIVGGNDAGDGSWGDSGGGGGGDWGGGGGDFGGGGGGGGDW